MADDDLDQIDVIVADLEQFTAFELVQLATNIDSNLRDQPPLGTPVDTGWAAANWMPSIGKLDLLDADIKGEPTPAQIVARAQEGEQRRSNLLNYKLADGKIFIANPVPYIIPLNEGHSPQSPPGFVLNAIVKGVNETQSAGANKAQRNRRAAAFRSNVRRPVR